MDDRDLLALIDERIREVPFGSVAHRRLTEARAQVVSRLDGEEVTA